MLVCQVHYFSGSCFSMNEKHLKVKKEVKKEMLRSWPDREWIPEALLLSFICFNSYKLSRYKINNQCQEAGHRSWASCYLSYLSFPQYNNQRRRGKSLRCSNLKKRKSLTHEQRLHKRWQTEYGWSWCMQKQMMLQNCKQSEWNTGWFLPWGFCCFIRKMREVLEELYHRSNLDFFPPPPSSWSPPVIMYFSTLYPTHIDD